MNYFFNIESKTYLKKRKDFILGGGGGGGARVSEK